MKAETEQVHWLVFFNDQLLLEKKDNNCVLPLGVQPPVKPLAFGTLIPMPVKENDRVPG